MELMNPSKRQRLDGAGIAAAAAASTPPEPSPSVPKSSSAMVNAQFGRAEAWIDSVTGTTLEFPRELPMQFQCRQPVFYVRECYPVYYELVNRLLQQDALAVTVTGTPGIGKSMFFAYFFLRFGAENNTTTIIAASFNTHSTMTEVAVWRGGRKLSQTTNWSSMGDIIERAEKRATDRVIYLYDGPPPNRPVGFQMVCFTSPNDDWFDVLNKSEWHPVLVMPLWELEELQTAAEEANLTLTAPLTSATQRDPEQGASTALLEHDNVTVADVIEQRFRIFGGVARECLSADEVFVGRRRTLIQETIAKVDVVPNLRRVLEATDNCICHWVPNPTDPQRRHSIAEPTTFVKRLLMQRLNEIDLDAGDKVLYCLRDAVAAASFRGTLFEIGVHEKLNFGGALTARQLSGGGPKTSECENSPPSRTVSSTATATRIFPLQVACSMFRAETYAPINSFYYPKPSGTARANDRGVLWLLLVTLEQTHPVNGEELAKTLKLLGMLETIEKDPQRAALAFVVPEENFPSFGPQEINLEISNDEDNVAKLRQIGDKMRKSLRNVGIDTIGDLRKRLATEGANNPDPTTKLAEGLSVATLRRLLAKHDEKQQLSGLKGAFDSIPQFVWEAELDDKYLRSRDTEIDAESLCV